MIAGHYVPFIKNNVFAVGGLLISLAAGWLYAKAAIGGWRSSLIGGLIVGGACALLGIGVSVLLRDVPPGILVFGSGTNVITLTGVASQGNYELALRQVECLGNKWDRGDLKGLADGDPRTRAPGR